MFDTDIYNEALTRQLAELVRGMSEIELVTEAPLMPSQQPTTVFLPAVEFTNESIADWCKQNSITRIHVLGVHQVLTVKQLNEMNENPTITHSSTYLILNILAA